MNRTIRINYNNRAIPIQDSLQMEEKYEKGDFYNIGNHVLKMTKNALFRNISNK